MATTEQRIKDGFAAVGADIKAIKTTAGTLAAAAPNTTITLVKPTGGSWPGVPTTRTDIIVIWKGADPSPPVVTTRTLGQAGILDNVDFRVVL